MPRADNRLSVSVSREELALLRKLSFPGFDEVLATATETDLGIELRGSRAEFDDLAGWVAGEANDARTHRRPRQRDLLDNIADELESTLAAYHR